MLEIDLHIHSLHSGHAYGTIYDICNEAAKKNMKVIGISDHGPALGFTDLRTFLMGNRTPKTINGVRLLWGCEANIQDNGKIDFTKRGQERVDYIIAGLHKDAIGLTDEGYEKNTEKYIQAIISNPVKIISHPTATKLEFDFLKVIETALDNNILPELNIAYLEKNFENAKKMIELVKLKNKKLIINSDAHFLHEIGDDSPIKKHWDELGLTKEMIINNYPEELMTFLGVQF